MFILLGILSWVIPIIIIVLIVRAITHRGHTNHKDGARPATYRDLMLVTVALSAGYAGAVTLYYLPVAIFGSNADNAVFTTRLVLGISLLVAGLVIRHVVGVFLMIMGLTGLVLAAPFVFNNLGSAGALLIVSLAFIVLVIFAIKIGRKA